MYLYFLKTQGGNYLRKNDVARYGYIFTKEPSEATAFNSYDSANEVLKKIGEQHPDLFIHFCRTKVVRFGQVPLEDKSKIIEVDDNTRRIEIDL